MVAALLAGFLAPAGVSAQATESAMHLRYSAEISLFGDPDPPYDNPSPMWAMTGPSPQCNPFCPQAPGQFLYWVLGPSGGAPGAGIPCTVTTPRGTLACTLTGWGAFAIASTGLLPGPYCNSYTQGPAHFFITIGGQTTHLLGSPLTVLNALPAPNWNISEAGTPSDHDQGVGSMVLKTARPNCGLDGPNFEPALEFDVSGAINWVDLP